MRPIIRKRDCDSEIYYSTTTTVNTTSTGNAISSVTSSPTNVANTNNIRWHDVTFYSSSQEGSSPER